MVSQPAYFTAFKALTRSSPNVLDHAKIEASSSGKAPEQLLSSPQHWTISPSKQPCDKFFDMTKARTTFSTTALLAPSQPKSTWPSHSNSSAR
jgi:hypothetical protein